MKNGIQKGDVLELTASAVVASGAGMLFGENLAIAVHDVASGAQGSFAMVGVFSLAAESADAWSKGDVLYWNDTNKTLTDVVGTNKKVGYAMDDKAALDLLAKVKLVEKV